MSLRADSAEIIQVFLGNPYAPEAGDRRSAKTLLKKMDIARALASFVRQGDIEYAKNLVLAVGHYEACHVSTDPSKVLSSTVFPASVGRAMPRPRGDYLRIVMAAGRCFRSLSKIRGNSEAMKRARRDTWAACFGDSLRHTLDLELVIRDHDILILGETGTGKEAFAIAVQEATPGDTSGGPAPRSTINAAAIPEALVESELFGHVRGSFTGATDTRTGRVRTADGGSFFLDEVGDLPSTTQVKLLRVIETNEVYPVGSDSSHHVDLRWVAATHKDLRAMVERKEFRRDLYERLAGNVLDIPPLRERPEDIIEIGRHFVRGYLGHGAKAIRKPETVDAWLKSSEARNHSWPGNVRELQNALRNLMLGLDPGLRTTHLAQTRSSKATDAALPGTVADASASMQQVSDWYMARVLKKTENNYTQTARILGIDRSTVRRRIRALAKS